MIAVLIVHPVCFVMELLSQLPVVTVGLAITVVVKQSIQHHRMVTLEGTVLQVTIVLEKHRRLFLVR